MAVGAELAVIVVEGRTAAVFEAVGRAVMLALVVPAGVADPVGPDVAEGVSLAAELGKALELGDVVGPADCEAEVLADMLAEGRTDMLAVLLGRLVADPVLLEVVVADTVMLPELLELGNLVLVDVGVLAGVELLLLLVVGVWVCVAPHLRQLPLGGLVVAQPQLTQQSAESSHIPPSKPFGRQFPKMQVVPVTGLLNPGH